MSSLGALSPTCRPARWPSAHDGLATIRAPGGVPERPKGTGCKPVGSAYGGSNPPAPIHSFIQSVTGGSYARGADDECQGPEIGPLGGGPPSPPPGRERRPKPCSSP